MFLRRLILVLMLLLAQLGSSVHALEHFKGPTEDHHLPGQVCLVCLQAHDQADSLTNTVPAQSQHSGGHVLTTSTPYFSVQTSRPHPKQQAPPAHLT